MATHAQGRVGIRAAWVALFGTEPTTRELQIVGAVSALESNYGDAPYRLLDHKTRDVLFVHRDTKNPGAIQCCLPNEDKFGPASGGCPENTFLATDRSPSKVTAANPDGFYDVCFKRFATYEEAFRFYLKTLLVGRRGVKAALASGSSRLVARKMAETTYHQTPVEKYAGAIQTNAAAIAASLGEPLAVSLDGKPEPRPTPRPLPVPRPGQGSPASASDSIGAVALLALAPLVYILMKKRRRS